MANPFKDWTPAMVQAHNGKVLSSVLAKERTPEKLYEADNLPPSAVPEQAVCDGTLAKKIRKGKNTSRVVVRVKSCRRKLLDPDNLTGGVKYFVDGLRYAGLIPDDAPDKIILEVSQEKVTENERTEIEIIS
jgi:hypothetical protein